MLRLTLNAYVYVRVQAAFAQAKGDVLMDGRKSESKREHKREERCMCVISKADIRTPIRGQCALLRVLE